VRIDRQHRLAKLAGRKVRRAIKPAKRATLDDLAHDLGMQVATLMVACDCPRCVASRRLH
jgi:hypothetical protein